MDKLSQANQSVVAQAQSELDKVFETVINMYDDPADQRDALLELVPAIARKYSNIDSVAAAEWYEKVRHKWIIDDDYTVDSRYDPDDAPMRKTVRRLAGHLWDDEKNGRGPDYDAAKRGLHASMDRWVKAGGRETIMRASKHDPSKPRYARVPSGAKTCAFCAMLASRGFVYASEDKAGALGQYHKDCDCEIIPSWDRKNPKIEGYDPDGLYREYLEARDSMESEQPTLKEILTAMKSQPGRYNDSFAPYKISVAKESDFAATIGSRHVSALNKLLNDSKHHDTAELFSRGTNEYRILDTKLPNDTEAHFSPSDGGIYLNLAAVGKHQPGHPPYNTLVHECSHMLDWILGDDKAQMYFSALSREGQSFALMLSTDARQAFNERLAKVQGGSLKARREAALGQLYMDVAADLGKKGDHSIHDMFQAGLGSQGDDYAYLLSRFGHRKGYFQSSGNQEAEAFAEMMAAQITDEHSWEIMEKYFPNATKMFNGMVKEALNGKALE